MPLNHKPGKKALKKNIETEMDSNPSPDDSKQNLAIAFNVQRQARKKKMMASGGMVEGSQDDSNPGVPSSKRDNYRPSMQEIMDDEMEPRYAQGGSVADDIMRRKRTMMADGGMVDIQENGDETGQTPYDDDNADAYDYGYYDTDQLSDQPLDSKGDEDEMDSENKDDMIGSIRKRMRSR